MNMTPAESKIHQLVDNVEADAQGWIEYMDSLTWVGGIGKRNPFYGKHHTFETIQRLCETSTGRPKSAETKAKLSAANSGENNPFYGKHHTPEIMERIRQANIGRPKTVEELAKLSAANSGENNPFYGKHHTDASKKKFVESRICNGTNRHTPETKAKLSAANSGENNPFYGKHHTAETKRKIVEGRMRNGTLGYFPEKTFTLLRIAKELHDAGVETDKIASLAIKQMKENGMKISKVNVYRVLPQEYKNPYRVVINRNNRVRK